MSHPIRTHPAARSSVRSHARLLASAILLVLPIALSAAGCQKTLLKKDDPRSPFDRYNQTRAQHAPPFLEDEYGRRTPNLRERLVQPDE